MFDNSITQKIAALESALKTQQPGTPGYISIYQQLQQEKAKLELLKKLGR